MPTSTQLQNPLMIERAIYSKDSTPEKDRDYKLVGDLWGPAGNLSDWEDFAKQNDYDGVQIFKK